MDLIYMNLKIMDKFVNVFVGICLKFGVGFVFLKYVELNFVILGFFLFKKIDCIVFFIILFMFLLVRGMYIKYI